MDQEQGRARTGGDVEEERVGGHGTNGKQELQETMGEWNGLFTSNGLKVNLEETEVLHIGH